MDSVTTGGSNGTFEVRNVVAGKEEDPHGINPHSPGAKMDKGKTQMSLVYDGFAPALKAIAEVSTFGANKYTKGGWKDVPDAENRYKDAMYRHLNACAEDPLALDTQSQLLHAAQAAWNTLAWLYFLIKRSEYEQTKGASHEACSDTDCCNDRGSGCEQTHCVPLATGEAQSGARPDQDVGHGAEGGRQLYQRHPFPLHQEDSGRWQSWGYRK